MKLQNLAFVTEGKQVLRVSFMILTDNIFETGAYQVPSKSQNPTVLGQGVRLVFNGHTLTDLPGGPSVWLQWLPSNCSTQNQVMLPPCETH